MKPRVSEFFSQTQSLKLGLDRVTNVLALCQNCRHPEGDKENKTLLAATFLLTEHRGIFGH